MIRITPEKGEEAEEAEGAVAEAVVVKAEITTGTMLLMEDEERGPSSSIR